MSSLLLDEHPLVVIPSLAVAVGLNEAIILQQVHYWCQRSTHEHEGRRWTHQTLSQWRDQFPFWSEDTIKRTCKSLRQKGLIEVRKLAADSRNRTNWYSVNYDKLPSGQSAPMHRVEGADCTPPSGQSALMYRETETSSETPTLFAHAPAREPEPKRKPVTYGGKAVPKEQALLAERVLEHYYSKRGSKRATRNQSGGATPDLKQVVGAIMLRPDVSEQRWLKAIDATFANPPDWVDGQPKLGHIFGARAVEWALENKGGNASANGVGHQGVDDGYAARRARRDW